MDWEFEEGFEAIALAVLLNSSQNSIWRSLSRLLHLLLALIESNTRRVWIDSHVHPNAETLDTVEGMECDSRTFVLLSLPRRVFAIQVGV